MNTFSVQNRWLSSCFLFVYILTFLSFALTSALQAGIVINKDTGVDYGNDLQAAIEDADEDQVLILDGTFTGNFTIATSLKLKGKNNSVVIDGGQAGSVLTITGDNDLETIDVFLNGLTIQNGFATNGGGIFATFTNLKLNVVEVKENEAIITGGGIASEQGSLFITNSSINRNTAATGGGINNVDGPLAIKFSEINRNEATVSNGGGILTNSSNVTISNSQITRNTAVIAGGGIANSKGSATSLDACDILLNSAGIGGGIHNEERLTITNSSTINENIAATLGGGLFNASVNAIASIFDSEFKNNTAIAGGAIFNDGATLNVFLKDVKTKNNSQPQNVNVKKN